MKKKTRKIIVGDKEYLYVINQKYNNHSSNISLKVSLEGFKNLTCTFQFFTWDDPITGSPLLVGVSLKNKETNNKEFFNINYPRTIREFILYGLENGWTGENKIEFQDGIDIIGKMGYEVSWLKP
ncbi:hypothetical protein GK047_25635 [Paenibacillus sp. SYP-B3998]|uniref:Uncharacterized protein n=1 Tax=Paenibacillus sp. SYP-B3998 TaxID=2678564 RepID=A0A6G4A680_9BACL|nr:hypothetical protein [Paenibacillus sp. SYP-B3998]NEW09331.1 hypothetical protein [Paenibacillus sp. SYP-B3998]